MREQPLDLRESLAIVRRRWIAIAMVAVLGLCGGVIYAALHLPEPRAAAQILLPAQTASGAEWTVANTETQAIIVTSSAVLAPVAASMSPSMTVDQLGHLVSASAEGGNVLRIEVRAPSSERAVQLASAIANQYQKYVKAHNAVGGATNPIGSAGAVTPPSTVRFILKDALLGLVAGLLVGTTVVLVRARRDHRLRRRDEIAGAIGVPVLASMEAEQYKSVADWMRLLERFDPSAMNAWTLRRVLRNLVPVDFDGQLTIHVVSFAGDKAALATGPELALFAAGSGIPTRLVPGDNLVLEPLIAACATVRHPAHAEQLLSFDHDNETLYGPLRRPVRWGDDPVVTDAQLVVSVVAVEPLRPELSAIVGPTILSVSSGFAVIDDLARVALASTKVGLGIDGIVVVNPDPTDSTTGSLSDRMGATWRAHGSTRQRDARSPAHITEGSTWRA